MSCQPAWRSSRGQRMLLARTCDLSHDPRDRTDTVFLRNAHHSRPRAGEGGGGGGGVVGGVGGGGGSGRGKEEREEQDDEASKLVAPQSGQCCTN
jgi:hypothetical protein